MLNYLDAHFYPFLFCVYLLISGIAGAIAGYLLFVIS